MKLFILLACLCLSACRGTVDQPDIANIQNACSNHGGVHKYYFWTSGEAVGFCNDKTKVDSYGKIIRDSQGILK